MNLLILSLLLFSEPKGWWPIHAFPKGFLYLRTSFIYDDNIFKYSREDLNKFESGLEPERFPFNTTDDLISRFTVGFSFPGKVPFGLRLTQNNYLRNPEKDYLSFATWMKWRRWGIEFKKIPRYLLRYYPDIDSPHKEYRACTYNLNQIGFSLEPSIGKVSLKVAGEFKGLHYSPFFREYDTKGMKGTLGLSLRRRYFKTYLEGSYERALSRAYDEEFETPETSDDPDISYKRWAVEFGIKKRLKGIPLSFGFSFRWRYKRFVPRAEKSSDFIDYYHLGRKDWDTRYVFGSNYRLNVRVSLFIEGLWEKRWVKSPYKPLIYEIKDYTRKRISVGLRVVI